MSGDWVKPKGSKLYHFRSDERNRFICGEAVPKSTVITRGDVVAYSMKCENCLLKFLEMDKESRER